MKKNNGSVNDEAKTDLRHDTMEFSASTDGDDILDSDTKNLEDDDISADELDFLEEDDEFAMAAALNEVEMERAVDVDNLPEEDWTDDLPDNVVDEEEVQ